MPASPPSLCLCTCWFREVGYSVVGGRPCVRDTLLFGFGGAILSAPVTLVLSIRRHVLATYGLHFAAGGFLAGAIYKWISCRSRYSRVRDEKLMIMRIGAAQEIIRQMNHAAARESMRPLDPPPPPVAANS